MSAFSWHKNHLKRHNLNFYPTYVTFMYIFCGTEPETVKWKKYLSWFCFVHLTLVLGFGV